MLTAEINNQPINCYDNKYDRDTLKKWADKGILQCPVCHGKYEYCHGKLVSPYFRHKDKTKCETIYSEPETEEHIQGKIALFNWIKKQNGVVKAVMEGYIEETKQRPDIMFEFGGQQYVIEFQCTPIASEQIERHELYQAAKINDIWIGGKEKYSTGRTHIENIAYAMFDYQNNTLSKVKDLLNKNLLPYNNLLLWNFNEIPLENVMFDGKFTFVNQTIEKYIDLSIKKHNAELKKQEQRRYIHSLVEVCKVIPEWYAQVCHHCKIDILEGKLSSPYLIMMKFASDITAPFTMFIKENSIDVCVTEMYNRRIKNNSTHCRKCYWQKATKFVKIETLKYSDNQQLVSVIKEYFSKQLQKAVINKYMGGITNG